MKLQPHAAFELWLCQTKFASPDVGQSQSRSSRCLMPHTVLTAGRIWLLSLQLDLQDCHSMMHATCAPSTSTSCHNADAACCVCRFRNSLADIVSCDVWISCSPDSISSRLAQRDVLSAVSGTAWLPPLKDGTPPIVWILADAELC